MSIRDFNPYLGHKDEVIRSYMDLARAVAWRFRWATFHAAHIDLHDLISEAYVGLVKAFQKFDGRVEKFETYAVPMMQWEIHQFIRRKGQPISIPRKTYALIGVIFRRGLHSTPVSTIAKEIGRSEIEIAYALKCLRENRYISLDEPVSPQDEHDMALLDIVGQMQDLSGVHVDEFLNFLDPKERRFVHMRSNGAEVNDLEMSDSVRHKLMVYMDLAERDVETMSVELTKERFLELKKQGKSDEAIAAHFGLGKSAIYKWKKKMDLTGKVPKVRPHSESGESPEHDERADDWEMKYHELLLESAEDESTIKALKTEVELLKSLLKFYLEKQGWR
jgi:RNA polymerase sigma factor (sigma-70 family)